MGQCFDKCLHPVDDDSREVDTAIVLAVAMRNAREQGAGAVERSECRSASATRASSAVLETGQQETAREKAEAAPDTEVMVQQAEELEPSDGCGEVEEPVEEVRAASYSQLLVTSEGDLESSTFIPKALRAGGDSASRRWGKADLLERDGSGVGNGAFASVVAVRTFAGSVLAVKKMERNHATRGNQDDFITRELGLLTECAGHPNVVEAVGYMKTTEMAYLMMPLADTDVSTVIQIEPLCQTEACHITHQMLSALRHLHGKSIIHFDVKPANLLLTGGAARRVLLADFGASQRVGDDEITTVMGTLPYLAPEVLSEDAELDTKVDIWAAGVVLYEMLHGFTPFSWEATKEISDGVIGGEIGGRGKSDGVLDSDTDDTEDSSCETREVLTDEDHDNAEKARISIGRYEVDQTRVDTVCVNFIATLLQVSPDTRVTAAKAAEDHWLGGPSVAAETEGRVHEHIAKFRESKTQERKEQMASFGRRRRVVRKAAVKVP